MRKKMNKLFDKSKIKKKMDIDNIRQFESSTKEQTPVAMGNLISVGDITLSSTVESMDDLILRLNHMLSMNNIKSFLENIRIHTKNLLELQSGGSYVG